MLPHDPTNIVVTATFGILTGLDLATGEVRWTCDLTTADPTAKSTAIDLAIRDGRVFAALGASLFCVDQRTGQGIFQAPLGEVGSRYHTTAILAVEAGVLVSQPGQMSMYAFDGRLVWTRELPRTKVLMGLVSASDVVAFGIDGQVRQIDSVGRE